MGTPPEAGLPGLPRGKCAALSAIALALTAADDEIDLRAPGQPRSGLPLLRDHAPLRDGRRLRLRDRADAAMGRCDPALGRRQRLALHIRHDASGALLLRLLGLNAVERRGHGLDCV